MKSHRWVALAGGLGNQIFQYAYAISDIKAGETSVLECVGFYLGKGKTSNPEIGKFNTPNSRLFTQVWNLRHFEKLSFNYLLRASARRRIFKLIDLFALIAYLIVLPRIALISYSRKRDLAFPDDHRFAFLRVGYFQDVAISERVVSIMQGMSLKEPSIDFQKYLKISEDECPLIVHIRRGDYLYENDFGCLSENYYQDVITRVWDHRRHKKIWLFSDDEEFALRMFDEKHLEHVRVIEPTLSAAETFEIMRLGADYIIANSSFSFWAARLRKNCDARVYSPSPWFKNAYFSSRNTPEDWIVMLSDFE